MMQHLRMLNQGEAIVSIKRMLTYADVCWRMLAYADVC